MRGAEVVLIAVALAACSKHAAPKGDGCTDPPPERTGDATYYDADGTGACSYPRAEAAADRMVAAMNGADYDKAAWCGACLEVDGPAGTVVVRVVDSCPGCASGDLDLSREAFAAIAEMKAGRVKVRWREVACDVTGPIAYKVKDGSSAAWAAIQIRNTRYPVTRVAVRRADGRWQDLVHQAYNYFVSVDGLGPAPVTLQVADDRGHVVAVGEQFPACTQ